MSPRRTHKEYATRTAVAAKSSCGGVALLARENVLVTAKNDKFGGWNMIVLELMANKEERWHAVGCYLSPSSDRGGGAKCLVEAALEGMSKDNQFIVMSGLKY